jgi:energy-coupling factor transporter ATP-binding protein EcfA2
MTDIHYATLELDNLSVSFGHRRVLNGFSLRVARDEWIALIGANGSGRSTLAEVMAAIRKPDRGSIRFDGVDLWTRRGRRARRGLGLVMQRAEDQFLGATVYEDIAFGPCQFTQDEREIESSVALALSMVDFRLEDVRDRSPMDFSGGQRRRLAVAGILALSPRVLIFDEPFAGLDSAARSDMVALLKRLRDRHGITIATLTSDLQYVREASRMALILDGSIALIGDFRDLVANSRLCQEARIRMPDSVRLALGLRQRGWNPPIFAADADIEEAVAAEWRIRWGAARA